MKKFLKTRDAMFKYAQQLKPSCDRAQCYTIANYDLGDNETISERLQKDHRSIDGALRAARLMVNAGCAQEINAKPIFYGQFIFEDQSILE